MPYQSVWVPPEVFMTYGGVNIFHVYKDDDIDQGRRTYWYSTSGSGDADLEFDVRELDTAYLLDQHPPYLQGTNDTPENRAAWRRWHEVGEPDTIKAIITASLDANMIALPEDMADNIADFDEEEER